MNNKQASYERVRRLECTHCMSNWPTTRTACVYTSYSLLNIHDVACPKGIDGAKFYQVKTAPNCKICMWNSGGLCAAQGDGILDEKYATSQCYELFEQNFPKETNA